MLEHSKKAIAQEIKSCHSSITSAVSNPEFCRGFSNLSIICVICWSLNSKSISPSAWPRSQPSQFNIWQIAIKNSLSFSSKGEFIVSWILSIALLFLRSQVFNSASRFFKQIVLYSTFPSLKLLNILFHNFNLVEMIYICFLTSVVLLWLFQEQCRQKLYRFFLFESEAIVAW